MYMAIRSVLRNQTTSRQQPVMKIHCWSLRIVLRRFRLSSCRHVDHAAFFTSHEPHVSIVFLSCLFVCVRCPGFLRLLFILLQLEIYLLPSCFLCWPMGSYRCEYCHVFIVYDHILHFNQQCILGPLFRRIQINGYISKCSL